MSNIYWLARKTAKLLSTRFYTWQREDEPRKGMIEISRATNQDVDSGGMFERATQRDPAQQWVERVEVSGQERTTPYLSA